MKLPAILIALAFLSQLPTALAETDLPFVNPGLEEGDTGWRIKENVPMTQVISDAAREGNGGMRVEDADDAEGSSAVSPALEVQPGGKYRVSFWARTRTPGRVGVYVWFYRAQAGELIRQEKTPVLVINQPGGDWQEYSLEVAAPADAVKMALWVHSLGKGTGGADLDDFRVESL